MISTYTILNRTIVEVVKSISYKTYIRNKTEIWWSTLYYENFVVLIFSTSGAFVWETHFKCIFVFDCEKVMGKLNFERNSDGMWFFLLFLLKEGKFLYVCDGCSPIGKLQWRYAHFFYITIKSFFYSLCINSVWLFIWVKSELILMNVKI